jgi:hypothetical protein
MHEEINLRLARKEPTRRRLSDNIKINLSETVPARLITQASLRIVLDVLTASVV